MKQFEFEYINKSEFERDLDKIQVWCKSSIISNIVFHIFAENFNTSRIDEICDSIHNIFPNAKYLGCSTNGNVYNGTFTKKDIIVCTVFEYVSTNVDVLQYTLTNETEKEVTNNLIEYVKNNPWVKSIEFLTTIRGMSMTKFCEHLSKLPENIKIFGGGAFAEDINDNTANIFSNKCTYSDHSVAFLLIGGKDYFVETSFISGWKPLGRELVITKSDGPNLIELDNKPAYDTYYRYLKIKNDKSFFKNTLEFPFVYNYNGIDILRAPTACTEDGTIIMASDMEENAKTRIAYGDPWTIIENVKMEAQKYAKFKPDSMAIFSCAARHAFWGDLEVTKELMPFRQISSTYGFYTSSEFQRTNRHLIQHNVTLAIAAMREGNINKNDTIQSIYTSNNMTSETSMISRLANFIQASTEELEDAIKQLKYMAITDGMTGLYTRKEIQNKIIDEINSNKNEPISLIMLDIDNFKHINDTYGHAEGDNVIVTLANMMKKNSNQHGESNFIGRWGGEEFMILCPNTNTEIACKIAEFIRTDFENLEFEKAEKCTISLGVTELQPGENSDAICIRVDNALYKAKATGKNKVVAL